MIREPRFAGEAEKQEREIQQELVKEGGIFYTEEVDPETKENRGIVNILGVELETYASKKDIDELKSPENLLLSETDQEMLRTIAETYKLRQPLLFEGSPGAGKTFLLERFTQLIHGKDAPILSITGTPRTSELEILGHWAPKGKVADEEKLGEVMSKLGDQEDYIKVREDLNEKLADINEKLNKGEMTEEEHQEAFGKITSAYENKSKELMMAAAKDAGISDDADWEFKRGALLQAYSGRGGKGQILIVDEFNLIPSNYQQIFLQVGGKNGGMSDQINFFGNSGKTQYKRGKDAWVAFAINPLETTPGRGEVVAPMTDRVVWKTLSQEDADSKKAVVTRTAGGRLSKRAGELGKINPEAIRVPSKDQLRWAELLDEKLGEQVADVVDILDKEFVKMYQQIGDTIEIKGEQRKRTQQLEFSSRNALRLFSYIDNFQIRDPESGNIDFKETLRNGFRRYYVDRLASSDLIKRAEALFEGFISGAVGNINFEGKAVSRGKVLDTLTDRAMITPEEKKKQEEKEKARKQGEQKGFKIKAHQSVSKLAGNPNIPDSVKKKLGFK